MQSRAARNTALAAWGAYLLSWFLPVVPASSELFAGINAGWQAFLMALSNVLKPDRIDLLWAMCVIGTLSNIPVLMSPLILRKRPTPAWFGVVMAAAFVLNLGWVPTAWSETLLAGYWLWVGSMGALAVSAFLNRPTSMP